MRLRILNSTPWRTDDLRRLISAVIRHEGMGDSDCVFEATIKPGRRRSAVELRTMVREALARSFREEHPDGTFRGFESIERLSLRRPAEVLVRWRLRR